VTGNRDDNENLDVYVSPFPRIESRITHATSNDKEKLTVLGKWNNANYIRELIYSRSE